VRIWQQSPLIDHWPIPVFENFPQLLPVEEIEGLNSACFVLVGEKQLKVGAKRL